MDNSITIVKIPSLLRTDLRESMVIPWVPGIRIHDVIKDYAASLAATGLREIVVSVDRHEVNDFSIELKPGEFVTVSPQHGFTAIQGLIWVALWNAGMFAGINAISGVLAAAVIVGGGMLVSNLFSSAPPQAQAPKTDSPTYGFSPQNTSKSGNPVAVVCGHVQTVPQVLNSYRRVSSDSNMWIYLLLGLGAGETNHVPTVADVWVGEALLTTYTEYTFGITSGKVTPDAYDEAALADKFSQIHHDRAFDRQLKYAEFYAEDVVAKGTATVPYGGALPIEDETITIGTNVWTFKATRSSVFQAEIGSSLIEFHDNLAYAVNTDDSVVVAAVSDGANVIVTAVAAGSTGNAIAFSHTSIGDLACDGSGYLGGTQAGEDATDPDNVFMVGTKGQVDAVRLIITFPHGNYFVSGGSLVDHEVEFWYGYRETGDTGAVTWANTLLGGGGTQVVRCEIDVTPPSRGKYDIFLQRVTADDPEDDSQQRSASFLTTVDEILSIFQVYPGIQCISLGIKASENLSGQLPAIKVIQNITARTVPDWDGVGTRVVDPSNHSGALFDALTNPATGRGISPTKIIQSRWESWGTWLDGLVDGEKRAQFNMIFDQPGNFYDNCLKYVEESGRCKVLRQGDYWSVAIDQPKTAQSYTFSSGNIIRDSFHWEGFEDPEKVDAVEIRYFDKDRYWGEKSVLMKASWYESLVQKPMIATFTMRSINNRDQAMREARFRMNKTEKITRYGDLLTLLRAAGLEPLDWVDIIHAGMDYGFGGVISRDHTSATTVYLDQMILLPAADYSGKAKLLIMDKTGTRQEYTVTGPWGTYTRAITISGGSYTGNRFDAWAIGRPNDEKLAYQIVNRRLMSNQEIKFDFVEYDPTMFYDSEWASGTVAI